MKKITLTIALCIISLGFLIAQNFPYGINYQAVARDMNGNAKPNQFVNVRFSIIKSSTTGTTVWFESDTTHTNSMGQFNLVIGSGFNTGGTAATFSAIDWNVDIHFMKVDIWNGSVYVVLSPAQQFQSVPYALNVKSRVPSIQRFLVGTGTYTTPPNVLYLKVKMAGGGAGGAGYPSAGIDGSPSTFGTGLLIANGGLGGEASTTPNGGIGGTIAVNTPAVTVIAVSGGDGGGGTNSNITAGGDGGNNVFGGGGGGGGDNRNGQAASPNSGGGGGGGGAYGGGTSCGGGGAGGYIEAIIPTPSSTYSYTVGTGGGGGVGSTSGAAGAAGIIIVEEFYK